MKVLLILLFLTGSVFGQTFYWTNLITVLPLPSGSNYVSVSRSIKVRTTGIVLLSTNGDTNAPSAPSHLQAFPILTKDYIDLVWGPAKGNTDFVYWVYSSTNLTSWSALTNLPSSATSFRYPMWLDALRFLKISASNDSGEVFIMKK